MTGNELFAEAYRMSGLDIIGCDVVGKKFTFVGDGENYAFGGFIWNQEVERNRYGTSYLRLFGANTNTVLVFTSRSGLWAFSKLSTFAERLQDGQLFIDGKEIKPPQKLT